MSANQKAVVNQPESYEMTPQPTAGLSYLQHLDQILIKQQIELLEALTGFETKNKYRVMNSQRQEVFFVAEESDALMRQCCGPNRGFIFHFLGRNVNGAQEEAMRMERPFLCCKGCPNFADGCCMYPIYVKDHLGGLIGIVRMTNYCCSPRFGVFDANGEQLFRIKGECCPCQGPCCRDDINFTIHNASDDVKVANIAKQWAGCGRECITDADKLSLTFPMSMNLYHKALLLASVFLIDMSLFEHGDQ